MPESFYNGKWNAANIPVKFRGRRLQDYEPIPGSGSARRAVRAAQGFVDTFRDHYVNPARAARGDIPENRDAIGRGLMFSGGNGTRKTSLATAILTDVQYRNPSTKIYYVRFSDWKRALTDTFTNEVTERTVNAKRLLEKAEFAHLLVLDDIGQEHRTSSGFTESSIHELLRVRYEAARPTIVTTNIHEEILKTVYGVSFDSFRNDAFDLHMVMGPDSRVKKD
jgi:DNA replication protein DnaC